MILMETLADDARITWFDTAGIVLGVGLVVAYVAIDSPNTEFLLYAGLVALAAHAYVSFEVLPKRQRHQAEAVEVAVAYREVLLMPPPSGMENHNGQHPPNRPRQPVTARLT